MSTYLTCSECHGSGRIYSFKLNATTAGNASDMPCPSCGGTGFIVSGDVTFTVVRSQADTQAELAAQTASKRRKRRQDANTARKGISHRIGTCSAF
jgi:DnaJ-class molecular chaperone